MALFKQEVKKSFADQLADIKSVFKKAHDEAVDVISQCDSHIAVKEEEVNRIKTEIKNTESVKSEAESFVNKLKDLT